MKEMNVNVAVFNEEYIENYLMKLAKDNEVFEGEGIYINEDGLTIHCTSNNFTDMAEYADETFLANYTISRDINDYLSLVIEVTFRRETAAGQWKLSTYDTEIVCRDIVLDEALFPEW